jgi:hypothetical protein
MSATLRLDGTSTGAVKAVQDYNKALAQTEQGANKSAAAAKRLEEAAKRMAAQASPLEKYNQQMARLAELTARGGLATEHAHTQAIKYRAELDGVGKAGVSAFGPQFLSMIGLAGGAVGAATAAVGFLRKSFEDTEQAAQKAADSVLNSLGSIGELQQLGPEGFKKGVAIARQLVRSGAVSSDNKSQAADIATDLINSGFNDQQLQFIVTELAAEKLVKPENLVGVGGNLRKLQRQFGVDDLSQVTASSLNAANATQANLSQTTREVVKFSTLASSSGLTLEEALAAFEVSEQRSASPEAAAENLKSLFSQVKRRGLASGDLQGTLANIQSKIKPGGNAFDVLGDANAVIGFEQLSGNLGQLTSREQEIAAAKFARSNLLSTDPTLQAATLRSRAEGALAQTQEDLTAERESLFDTLQSRRAAQRLRDGVGTFKSGAERASFGVVDFFEGEREQLEFAVEKGNVKEFGLTGEDVAAIRDYLRRSAEASEGTNNATRSKVTTLPE